ncbi:MAG: hypothetical protein AB7G80_07080 [Dongiaceae bacterium]
MIKNAVTFGKSFPEQAAKFTGPANCLSFLLPFLAAEHFLFY